MFRKILFPVDLEHKEVAAKALKLALEEVEKYNASIHIMTVAPGFGMPLVASFFDDNAVSEALKEIARHLKKFVADNIPDNIETHTVVVEGNPAEQILKQAKKRQIDLIVISSHDSEIEQMLLGSCSAKVVRHSRCSVLVVKN